MTLTEAIAAMAEGEEFQWQRCSVLNLVVEVLARLPCKSLMRFKCLLKLLHSTISDPSFSMVHRRASASTSLFITRLDHGGDSTPLGCFYAPPQRLCATFLPSEMIELPSSDFQNIDLHNCGVWIHEMRERKFEEQILAVVMRWNCSSESEILILGKNASWRRQSTAHFPQINWLRNQSSVYIDGVLCCRHGCRVSVILFNFIDESLHVVHLPERAYFDGLYYFNFGGRFDLASEAQFGSVEVVDRKLELWILELNYEGGGRSRSNEWINQIIDFLVLVFLGTSPQAGVIDWHKDGLALNHLRPFLGGTPPPTPASSLRVPTAAVNPPPPYAASTQPAAAHPYWTSTNSPLPAANTTTEPRKSSTASSAIGSRFVGPHCFPFPPTDCEKNKRENKGSKMTTLSK
ncbi:hypothetical protein Acr_01g0007000 [Actinidia rufa]|uniref:Uncharacterized protein n=1 Tax=Actinidia rufa TaxID=165716 RepID=A0A7J0E307_9ERIC|nr:hypothetical protein Acr_01g0007000 [Actinidia rufa]